MGLRVWGQRVQSLRVEMSSKTQKWSEKREGGRTRSPKTGLEMLRWTCIFSLLWWEFFEQENSVVTLRGVTQAWTGSRWQ
jgi:hypothetical protein